MAAAKSEKKKCYRTLPNFMQSYLVILKHSVRDPPILGNGHGVFSRRYTLYSSLTVSSVLVCLKQLHVCFCLLRECCRNYALRNKIITTVSLSASIQSRLSVTTPNIVWVNTGHQPTRKTLLERKIYTHAFMVIRIIVVYREPSA